MLTGAPPFFNYISAMLDFSNTEIAFSSKSNSDLRLAYILFSAIASRSLVKVLKGATNVALAVKLPVGWAVKPTLYRHFVGGETLEGCAKGIKNLLEYNVSAVLDYSAEAGQSMEDIQNAFDETIHSIEFAAKTKGIPYTVFKPTAMTTDELLAKASAGEKLSEAEQIDYNGYKERIYKLCKKAHDLGVRILIDAEDYCFQADIDRVTEEMMRTFNKERAIVFNTLQMYRHDRYEYLKWLHQDSIKNNYFLGIKFVRGAYMEKERERALKGGYPSPICDTKEQTDANYNQGIEYTVAHIDRIETFSGTHNEHSNQLLAELMVKHGIAKDDNRIFFAQLYGMSDNISYNLAKDGYNVTKYVPYAPVDRVLPYLIRRAEENTSMAGQTSRELDYITKEIKRRKIEITE